MRKRLIITFTAAAACACLLAGCGSGSNASSNASEGRSGEDNKLYVYNWGEYIDEDVIPLFEEETGI